MREAVRARALDVALAWHTPARWATAALAEPDALLSDHAHCELGAAAAAQSLLARRPANARLVERMAALAVEELAHFRRVHRLLRARGGALAPAEKNPYVQALHKLVRPSGEAAFLDRLLVAALVERRSLERFELLAGAAEGELGALYAELAPSEAGHARLFLELAADFATPDALAERLAVLAGAEADLVRALPFRASIHSGPPAARVAGVVR